jgi:hypothetical protein
VDRIADNGGEVSWIRGARVGLDKIMPGLDILFDGQFAKVCIKKGYERIGVLLNVAAAPFDLEAGI